MLSEETIVVIVIVCQLFHLEKYKSSARNVNPHRRSAFFLVSRSLGRIEVERVKREIVVVVNIMVVRCKIIGDRPRTLFMLIANVLFPHDDASCVLQSVHVGTPQYDVANFSP